MMLHEFEQELFGGLASRPAVRPRIRIRYARQRSGEMEFEAFDPSPPPPGTRILSGFAVGGAALNASHRRSIDQIAREIVASMPGLHPAFTIVVDVEGHEDETGDPALFQEFGLARATNVAQALARRLEELMRRVPVANQRSVEILVSSAGPTRPIRSNATAAGRTLNRRVEIRRQVVNRTI